MFPDHVLVRMVDDELVLLDLDSERYFSINGPSAHFLDRLDLAPSIEAGAADLLNEYETDLMTLMDDLQRMAQSLIEAGLLAVAP